MKKIFRFCSILFFAIFAMMIFSCVTSEKIISPEPKKDLQDENKNLPSLPLPKKEKSELEKYNEIFSGITLSVLSAPKEITKGKEFLQPFVVKAEKNGSAFSGAKILVAYPDLRSEEKIKSAFSSIETGVDGIAQFFAPKPEQSFFSEVIFSPNFESEDSEVLAEREKVSVRAPFRVKTNLQVAGGSVAIVDFDSEGRPIFNNSASASFLLSALMKAGFKGIGNADFSLAITSGKGDDSVLREAKSLFGNDVRFLIFGTVKYEKPIFKDGNVFCCNLIGELSAYDMKTGELLTKTKKSISAIDSNEKNVLSVARRLLSEEFCEALVYGL